jgi:hypothetical protein
MLSVYNKGGQDLLTQPTPLPPFKVVFLLLRPRFRLLTEK